MALEGTIKEFGLADILQLIGLQKKTGILQLIKDDEEVSIFFEDGAVVRVEDSRTRTKNLTGTIFVNRGKITEKQLAECLEIQKSTSQKIGGVLIGQGLINKDELKDVLTFQLKEIIYRVFRWKGGDYKFTQAAVDYDRDTFQPLTAEHILMDGVRMLDEWPIIEKKISSMDIVLGRKEDALQSFEDEDDAGEDIFAGPEEGGAKGLDRNTESVLKLVDGRRNIYEILELSRLGEFDTCKAIVDLLNGGYIIRTDEIRPEPGEKEDIYIPVIEKAPSRHLVKIAYAALIVAAVILYQQVSSPARVADSQNRGAEALKVPLAKARIDKLMDNIQLYYLDIGTYPRSASELVKSGYISEADSIDPWDRPMLIIPDEGGGITVLSSGPDLAPYTADDIKDENKR